MAVPINQASSFFSDDNGQRIIADLRMYRKQLAPLPDKEPSGERGRCRSRSGLCIPKNGSALAETEQDVMNSSSLIIWASDEHREVCYPVSIKISSYVVRVDTPIKLKSWM